MVTAMAPASARRTERILLDVRQSSTPGRFEVKVTLGRNYALLEELTGYQVKLVEHRYKILADRMGYIFSSVR